VSLWHPVAESSLCVYDTIAAPLGSVSCQNSLGDHFPCGEGSSCCGNACAAEGSKCCGKDAKPPLDVDLWHPVAESSPCVYDASALGSVTCQNKLGDHFSCGEGSSCCGNACAAEGSKCCGEGAHPPVDVSLWHPVAESSLCVYDTIAAPLGSVSCQNSLGDHFPCGEGSSCCGNACAAEGSKCCGKDAKPPLDVDLWHPVAESSPCVYDASALGSVTCQNKLGDHFYCGEGSSCCGNACAAEGSKCCGEGATPPVDVSLWHPIAESSPCVFGH